MYVFLGIFSIFGPGGGSVLDGFKKKSTLGDFWNPGAPLMAVDMFVHSELDEEGFLKIWQ